MELVEEVRSWLIQEKIGFISEVDLLQLVDKKIAELDKPPDYLISISLKERIDHIPRLDLLKDRIENNDCAIVAKKMLSALHDNTASYNDIGSYSLKMCKFLASQDRPYLDFLWIDDEVHLMNEGLKENKQSKKDIDDVLAKLSTLKQVFK